MKEANNPVDIGKEQLAKYQSTIEDRLNAFPYAQKTWSLAQSVMKLDPNERFVMSDLERDTYMTIREGLTFFKFFTEFVGEKAGLRQALIAPASSGQSGSPNLSTLRDFCYSFAAYASSKYISKKLEGILAKEGYSGSDDKPNFSLRMDFSQPFDGVFINLLAPIYGKLEEHERTKEVFKTPLEFSVFVKEIFDEFQKMALAKKDQHPTLLQHIDGYQFRMMDEFLTLQGYEDRTVSHVSVADQKPLFQPISANEISGNDSAKRKISRYIDRLVLYDFQAQKNPILEIGGLAWTVLLDGPPGTGKSSLFRLAMTLLDQHCQSLGLKYAIFSVDQSIKDEFYGKTGKILLERISVAKDPSILFLGIFDDIDLLTSKRDDAQGADNDINNISMQYLDGVSTVTRGNGINFAATNKPTGLDDAFRNRFSVRELIDGPRTAEQFADMVNILGKSLFKHRLLKVENGYVPFSTQDRVDDRGHWSSDDVASYMADEFKKYKGATLLDFGRFMTELKEKNPLITGRSAKAIIDSIKERTADFDIPREWYENRALFLDLPYDRKVEKLVALHHEIAVPILFQEAKRYFDSEERYTRGEADSNITRQFNQLLWELQAKKRFFDELIKQGDQNALFQLRQLESQLQSLLQPGKKGE